MAKPKKEKEAKPAEKAAPEEAAKPAEKQSKKKEKRSQKERPKSKKKHAKIQAWKLYSLKDNKAERKNQNCPRCGPGTFLASYQHRKYCGKCGWALVHQERQGAAAQSA